MASTFEMRKFRTPEYDVNPIILNRWSPRAMSGETIPSTRDNELMSLFEAAKWAPSSGNSQPWRFLYALRDTDNWDKFFNLLVEKNQQWAKNAAALIVILSRKRSERNDKPIITHSFDTGAAWQNLALQGSNMGFVVHGMAGFDYEKARADLNIPEVYAVEAMCAVGRPGNLEDLPEDLQMRENPSGRKTISEIVCEGTFKESR